jgi:tetratricopeptide (TPR) repeat protein
MSSPAVENRMKLITLACPSCSGALEVPDNLTVAHCMYCGTKIMIDVGEQALSQQKLQHYTELCRVAVEAKNHAEVIDYCNKILELDPQSLGAWVNKATSTFWLTTGANNRYDEAMSYLNKASQLQSGDKRIQDAHLELALCQALWFSSQEKYIEALGYVDEAKRVAPSDEKVERARAKIVDSQTDWLAKQAIRLNELANRFVYKARSIPNSSSSSGLITLAIACFGSASDCKPADMNILTNMAELLKVANLVDWSNNEVAQKKMKLLSSLRAKQAAEPRLKEQRSKLESSLLEWRRLQTQNGLFVKAKSDDAARRYHKYKSEVEVLEQQAAFEPPLAVNPGTIDSYFSIAAQIL